MYAGVVGVDREILLIAPLGILTTTLVMTFHCNDWSDAARNAKATLVVIFILTSGSPQTYFEIAVLCARKTFSYICE